MIPQLQISKKYRVNKEEHWQFKVFLRICPRCSGTSKFNSIYWGFSGHQLKHHGEVVVGIAENLISCNSIYAILEIFLEGIIPKIPQSVVKIAGTRIVEFPN